MRERARRQKKQSVHVHTTQIKKRYRTQQREDSHQTPPTPTPTAQTSAPPPSDTPGNGFATPPHNMAALTNDAAEASAAAQDVAVPDAGAEQPLDLLYGTYLRFCAFGKGHRIDPSKLRMDSRTFLKIFRDAGLLDRNLSVTRVDLVFTKLTGNRGKFIDFETFLDGLRMAAVARRTTYEGVVQHITDAHLEPSNGTRRSRRRGPATLNAPAAYSVRTATPDDLDAIVALQHELAAETCRGLQLDPQRVQAGTLAGLAPDSSSRTHYWVAETGGGKEVVGFASVSREFDDWFATSEWWITHIFVNRPNRLRGVGKLLIKAIFTSAKQDRASCVQLKTMKGNDKARRLFTQHGFKMMQAQVVMFNTSLGGATTDSPEKGAADSGRS